MSSWLSVGGGFGTAVGKLMTAVTAAGRKHLDYFIDTLGRNQIAPAPAVTRLPSRLPPALLLPASRSLFARQSVGRRWFGRCCGVPPLQSELPLQIRNLLLAFGDPLFGFCQLPPQIPDLAQQTVILAFQTPLVRLRRRLAWPPRTILPVRSLQIYTLPGFSAKSQV